MLLQLCDNHGSTEGPRGATSVARRRAASESIDSDLDLGVQNKTDDEKTRGAGSRGVGGRTLKQEGPMASVGNILVVAVTV